MHVCKYHSEFDYRINSCKNIVLLGFILLYWFLSQVDGTRIGTDCEELPQAVKSVSNGWRIFIFLAL
jgi:hypothetical protein